VIKSFAHKGLEAFFTSGSKAGIQGSHAARLARQLAQLHRAVGPRDMALPGWKLHPLSRASLPATGRCRSAATGG
jgi:proteic killer suppression protein